MIERLIEIGRRYEIEMNVKKNQVIRISRQPSPLKMRADQKQLDVEYFI
jgi:hypothetical protein